MPNSLSFGGFTGLIFGFLHVGLGLDIELAHHLYGRFRHCFVRPFIIHINVKGYEDLHGTNRNFVYPSRKYVLCTPYWNLRRDSPQPTRIDFCSIVRIWSPSYFYVVAPLLRDCLFLSWELLLNTSLKNSVFLQTHVLLYTGSYDFLSVNDIPTADNALNSTRRSLSRAFLVDGVSDTGHTKRFSLYWYNFPQKTSFLLPYFNNRLEVIGPTPTVFKD